MSSKRFSVCTFYHYYPIQKEKLFFLQEILISAGEFERIRGLLLLSEEGINATLVGPLRHLKRFLEITREHTGIPIQGRWQFSHIWGFKKFRLKIKKEIVTSGKKELNFLHSKTHLNPSEWNHVFENEKPTILDIRNNYEFHLGKFKQSVHLDLDQFQDFSKKLKNSSLSKSKKTLIYCTGGIRCEKALIEMNNQGFKNVKQLKGGILNYLSQFPNFHYKGECFVFDHRVSLNQDLSPSSTYKLCPHCGQPGNLEIRCKHCDKKSLICSLCCNKDKNLETCSKNCAYHFKLGHNLKKKRKHEVRK